MNVTIRGDIVLCNGERQGHNIVAPDFGYTADGVLAGAPGGTYPAANLGLPACHDPHGRLPPLRRRLLRHHRPPHLQLRLVQQQHGPHRRRLRRRRVPHPRRHRLPAEVARRLLRLPQPGSRCAVVASTYNRSEAISQTGIAYGQGMSEWCANCHTAMLQNGYTSGMAGLRHPAGNGAKLGAAVATNYNAYVSSGIMTNITAAKAFSTLAPFELGTTDYSVLKPQAVTGTGGNSNHAAAAATNNVACVSCHRAHATAFESALRFFYLNEFMTVADSANAAIYDSNATENKINYGFSAAQQQNAYYGRPATVFGPYARSYCNKCHAKD